MWVVWKSLVLQTKKWKGSTINIKWKYIWKQIEPAIKTNEKNLEFSKNLLKEKIIEPEKKNKTSKEIPNKVKKLKNENKGSKFFSYLIVFIISIVALIIFLDTLSICDKLYFNIGFCTGCKSIISKHSYCSKNTNDSYNDEEFY